MGGLTAEWASGYHHRSSIMFTRAMGSIKRRRLPQATKPDKF